MPNLTVSVEKQDIKAPKRSKHCETCVIANAISRVLPAKYKFSVGSDSCEISLLNDKNCEKEIYKELPQKARTLIYQYDCVYGDNSKSKTYTICKARKELRDNFKPFKFTLRFKDIKE